MSNHLIQSITSPRHPGRGYVFGDGTRYLLRQTFYFFDLLKESAVSWQDHKTPRMGAALSYYTAFSLAPLITLTLSIGSLAVKRADAARGLVEQFSSLVGVEGGKVVEEIVTHAGTMKALSWSAVLSFILLLVSASGAFGELQDSLNEIWDTPSRKKNPWLTIVKERLLSFSMVFILGFFMLTSLIISAVSTAISRHIVGSLHIWTLEGINTVASLVIITTLFATLFRMLPAVALSWRDVFPGALFSAVLFLVGKYLLGLYIARSAFASSYGVAGSFIVLLVWVFYSAQILYFGAEFTRAYTRKRTDPPEKKPDPEKA
ncbi:membrane protein [Verrucomicrobium sp. GAS474]|uniref:YihY/virulence factor BrkB family protein n=1 Tax=Verrucomicrobium sp. GAS474 TaxID=1882831 RepID=UPI00087B4E9B|nr:YihY/virulence factor BrkB family protein [Verrucomicrobium sp. GAS474]SDU05278.1 membrane protein [Verrucomicrobium sp. GAS474]